MSRSMLRSMLRFLRHDEEMGGRYFAAEPVALHGPVVPRLLRSMLRRMSRSMLRRMERSMLRFLRHD